MENISQLTIYFFFLFLSLPLKKKIDIKQNPRKKKRFILHKESFKSKFSSRILNFQVNAHYRICFPETRFAGLSETGWTAVFGIFLRVMADFSFFRFFQCDQYNRRTWMSSFPWREREREREWRLGRGEERIKTKEKYIKKKERQETSNSFMP